MHNFVLSVRCQPRSDCMAILITSAKKKEPNLYIVQVEWEAVERDYFLNFKKNAGWVATDQIMDFVLYSYQNEWVCSVKSGASLGRALWSSWQSTFLTVAI